MNHSTINKKSVKWSLMLAYLFSLMVKASGKCPEEKLSVYEVSLVTEWSEKNFPKQYPMWRPHAQWSKVLGRTHNDSYKVWRFGDLSTEGLKEFAERGKSDILDEFAQGDDGIYDVFSAPPIGTGVGRTKAKFFADGNHSKVSLISRIIPSPDWFVGVDSFELCVNGKWLDTTTLDVGPVDAGTENGFTFTAPTWQTEPRRKISRITARHPNHAASSFYYPQQKKLPRIAYFQFTKIRTYSLTEAFSHSEEHSVAESEEVEDKEKESEESKKEGAIFKQLEMNTVGYEGTVGGFRIKIMENADGEETTKYSKKQSRTRKLRKSLKKKRRFRIQAASHRTSENCNRSVQLLQNEV
ncbi:spondin-2-like [Limulus polyphemus]|uniref:Spondin-2-like n=1 Tax=Limulus polyphemus TaxID=6850 RepID=A0ABM1AZF6_LIMPO|nr:spondin-2-like [Limulus polyphemus]